MKDYEDFYREKFIWDLWHSTRKSWAWSLCGHESWLSTVAIRCLIALGPCRRNSNTSLKAVVLSSDADANCSQVAGGSLRPQQVVTEGQRWSFSAFDGRSSPIHTARPHTLLPVHLGIESQLSAFAIESLFLNIERHNLKSVNVLATLHETSNSRYRRLCPLNPCWFGPMAMAMARDRSPYILTNFEWGEHWGREVNVNIWIWSETVACLQSSRYSLWQI